ncbi:hypothetical protein [Streptomyces sp. NBC_01408]|uniref:hypothetical protein n=1 Tax=Streptomyces sp. NBC_01408 TaxID=2903855 RepID=UPI00224F6B21|nr:hypothetical protein [Streptomyces sp. NBC_01408]MCX4693666.1 hypothetical protein [Streptomyces sp. NBC_01408]
MPSAAGDRFTIRIGGDASAPVVAGHHNHVEVHRAAEPAVADEPGQAPGATQTNTASDHASVYTVMNGELHIHQYEDQPAPHTAPDPPSAPPPP